MQLLACVELGHIDLWNALLLKLCVSNLNNCMSSIPMNCSDGMSGLYSLHASPLCWVVLTCSKAVGVEMYGIWRIKVSSNSSVFYAYSSHVHVSSSHFYSTHAFRGLSVSVSACVRVCLFVCLCLCLCFCVWERFKFRVASSGETAMLAARMLVCLFCFANGLAQGNKPTETSPLCLSWKIYASLCLAFPRFSKVQSTLRWQGSFAASAWERAWNPNNGNNFTSLME